MERLRRFWPILFFAIIPLVPLWRAVFLSEAIGPFDQVRQFAPWNGPVPAQPWDVLQADGVLQFYPWRDLVFDAWRHGQMPLWNPYELAGYPLLANSQSGALYPPHIAVGLAHLPTPLGLTLLAWFHLAWAGLGVYFVTRRLGGSKLGAAVGGASFTLSSFMLAWTALPSVIETVSWIPWMLAATLWLFQAERRGKPFSLLALSTGMMFLAGHLQFCAYGLLAALTAAVWQTLPNVKRNSRSALLFVGAMALGCLIAAPQLVPVLDYGQFSHRRGAPSEEGYEAYVSSALQPFELATLASPTALGDPREFAAGAEGKAPAYWPQFVKPGANFAESAVGIGPLVLTLLFLVPWRRRGVGLFAFIGAMALLLALGTNLNRLLYFGFPGWSASGSPGRVEILFVLAACCLAGLGMAQQEKLWRALLAPALAIACAVLLPQLVDFSPGTQPIAFLRPAALMSSLITLLATSAVALAVATFSNLARAPLHRATILASPVLVALSFAATLIPTGKPLRPVAADPHARIAVLNRQWRLFPAPANALLPPNTASLSRIHELGGYDSLLHRDTVQYLRSVDGQDPAPLENGNMMFVKPPPNPRLLADAGVNEIWSLGPNGSLVKTPVPGPGVASTPQGPARIVGERFDGFTIQAVGPGPLTLRDRNMPGWHAAIDGKPAEIEGGLWKTVELPAGPHTVVFHYAPRGVNLWPISLLLLALAAWATVKGSAG